MPIDLPGALRDFVFACPACGHPSAQTVEPDVDIHAGASYTCDQCGAEVHFEALTRAEYLALAGSPPRAWTYCCDSLPETEGRYEVAVCGRLLRDRRFHAASRVGEWERGSSYRGGWRLGPDPWVTWGDLAVYAWRPIVEDPPPLRPADRDFLLAAGVPAEWLTEPKGD
jgi:hypothetical protein